MFAAKLTGILKPEHRITKMRGDMKKTIAPLIKDYYKLKPGAGCKERVDALLCDMQYVYPGDVMVSKRALY
jgi:hypothetical protein